MSKANSMAEQIRNVVINSNILKSILVKLTSKFHDEYKELFDDLAETKEKLDSLESNVNDRIAEELTKLITDSDEEFDTLKEISDWIKSDTTGAAKMQSDIVNNQTNISNLEANKVSKGEYELSKEFVSDVNLDITVVQPEFSATAEAPEINFNQITPMNVVSEVDDSQGVLVFEGEVEDGKLNLTGKIEGLVINNTITQPEFEASNARLDRLRDANVVSTSNEVNFRIYHQIDDGRLTLSGTFATPVISNVVTQPVYSIESIPQTIILHRDVDVNLGINNEVKKEKPIINFI